MAKTSSIRSAVSIERRLVTDGRTRPWLVPRGCCAVEIKRDRQRRAVPLPGLLFRAQPRRQQSSSTGGRVIGWRLPEPTRGSVDRASMASAEMHAALRFEIDRPASQA